MLNVYYDDDVYISQHAFSGKVLLKDSDPAKVIEHSLAQLAESGGKIELAPGEYLLDRTLTIPARTTLAGQGKSTRLIFESGDPVEAGLLVSTADDVTLRDLALVNRGGFEAGVVVENSGSAKVQDLLVVGFKSYGIWLRTNTFLSTVQGCEVAGNGVSNIYLDKLTKDGRYGDFLPNTVSECMIYGGGKGIETRNAIVANLIGNSIYQTNGHAFHLHSVSNSVLISGNRTFQITGHAVLVEKTDELNVSSNIFCWHTGSGIVVRNGAWGTVTANKFIDNGSYNPGGKNNEIMFESVEEPIELIDGMVFENVVGYTISSNTVFNWNVCPKMKNGLVEDAKSYNNTITNNTFNFYAEEDVVALGTGTEVSGNVSRGDFPYTNIVWKEKKDMVHEFTPTIIQTYQTELTEEYIKRND